MENNTALRLFSLPNKTLKTAKHGRQSVLVPAILGHLDVLRVREITTVATSRHATPAPMQPTTSPNPWFCKTNGTMVLYVEFMLMLTHAKN